MSHRRVDRQGLWFSGCPIRRGWWLGISLALLVFCGAANAAVLPAGSFVLDGDVSSVVRSGSNVFVSGSFTQQRMLTGGGLVLSQGGSGTPDGSQFPRVAGSVAAAAADGSGGWFVGGDFTHVGGQARSGLAHILGDGTLDATWNPNPSSPVYALAVSGSTVYAGGSFYSIGGQPRRHLAALDATTGNASAWNPNPDGLFVYALAVSGSTVYAGGYFSSIGGQPRSHLAALDAMTGSATAWNPNPSESVYALAVSGSTVYAGGSFYSIGGQSRSGLAALDATTASATAWNPNPADRDRAIVGALAVSGSTVYAGGQFSAIGGQSRSGLAALDATIGNATAWNPGAYIDGYVPALNHGPTGLIVSALAVSGSTVYAGGKFTSIGGQRRRGLAALDATTANVSAWNPNPNGPVTAVAVSGSSVYVGGQFYGAGALAAVARVAKLNARGDLDTSWSPNTTTSVVPQFGVPVVLRVDALAASGSTVYAAGNFTSIGGQPRSGLAALDATTGDTTAWNPNLNGSVSGLAVSGSTVYASGGFSSIGGQPRRAIAALEATTGNATAWNPNPDGFVSALVVSGSTVYAGGRFTSIGGQSRRGLAALDATTANASAWNPNPDGDVSELAVSGSTVYAGGRFTSIGGQPRSGLAAVDATTANATAWNPNPTADYGGAIIHALAASDSTVYAGGNFSSIGGQPRRYFAALDATTGNATAWNPDPKGFVSALAVAGSTVYAGGGFFLVDGMSSGPFAALTDSFAPPDTRPPTITIETPVEGQRFEQGQTVSSVFACSDANGSGMQSCTGPPSVDTATNGERQFTVSASDIAGNTVTKTVNYVVDPPLEATTPTSTTAPPPPIDATAPAARLTGAVQKLAKTVAVSISCIDEPCTAVTVGSVRVPRVGSKKAKTYKLSTTRTQIAKGQKVTVKLRLPAPALAAIKRALKAGMRVVVTIKATVTDAAGNTRLLSRHVQLRR